MIPSYFKKTSYDPKDCLCSLADQHHKPKEEGCHLLVRLKTEENQSMVDPYNLRGKKPQSMKEKKMSLKAKNKENEPIKQLMYKDCNYYSSTYNVLTSNGRRDNRLKVSKPRIFNARGLKEEERQFSNNSEMANKHIKATDKYQQQDTLAQTRTYSQDNKDHPKPVGPKISISYLKKKILASYIPYAEQTQPTVLTRDNVKIRTLPRANTKTEAPLSSKRQNKEVSRLRSVKSYNLDDLCFKKAESIDGESLHVSQVIDSGLEEHSMPEGFWGTTLSQLMGQKKRAEQPRV